jgi:hypothetical protein
METRTKLNMQTRSHKPSTARSKKSSLESLLDRIAAMGEKIPPEERALIPRDAAMNVEHYLYGVHKGQS